MLIYWLKNKVGSALTGEVLEERPNSYIVRVVSNERKSDRGLVGQKMIVDKRIVNRLEKE